MINRLGLIAIVWMAWTIMPAYTCAQTETKVTSVAVKLEFAGEAAFGGSSVGPETMAQLEQALQDTVRVALLEQLDGDLEYIVGHQSAVVQTLGEVINSALAKRGFGLEELVLDPGVETTVTVRLHLAGERVQDFDVSFSLLGDTPAVQSVVACDEEAVAADLYTTLARTPYGDARWLSGLVRDTVEQRLSGMAIYSDFDHAVLVQPGQTTKVLISFTPRAGVLTVSDYKLHLRSLTVLNATLAPERDELAHYLISLRGAPLSFVAGRLDEIQQALYQHVINHPALARQCADADIALTLSGCVLTADVDVDSQRYLTALSARLALWNYSDQDLEGRITARVGVQPQAGWAALAAVDYFPSAGEAFPMLGVERLIDAHGLLAAGWDFNAASPRFLGQYDVSPQAYLSADVIAGSGFKQISEIGLHCRIRDIYELQLNSNLDGEVFAALAAEF
jgi:hypothetical protein